jgi:hypothetical protein
MGTSPLQQHSTHTDSQRVIRVHAESDPWCCAPAKGAGTHLHHSIDWQAGRPMTERVAAHIRKIL